MWMMTNRGNENVEPVSALRLTRWDDSPSLSSLCIDFIHLLNYLSFSCPMYEVLIGIIIHFNEKFFFNMISKRFDTYFLPHYVLDIYMAREVTWTYNLS